MTRGQAQAGSPSLDERLVKELANLAFVAEATNILLRGPPGVGKTHLAVALALKAIESGQGAYFVRAYDWKPPGVSRRHRQSWRGCRKPSRRLRINSNNCSVQGVRQVTSRYAE